MSGSKENSFRFNYGRTRETSALRWLATQLVEERTLDCPPGDTQPAKQEEFYNKVMELYPKRTAFTLEQLFQACAQQGGAPSYNSLCSRVNTYYSYRDTKRCEVWMTEIIRYRRKGTPSNGSPNNAVATVQGVVETVCQEPHRGRLPIQR